MFPKDEELNRDILADEGGFIDEDGAVRSVENGKLANFLHANQPDDLSKGKSSSSIKKFFDYIAVHVILPWLRALTEKINAIPAWAREATKPTYTADEVGALPNTYVPPNQTAEQVGADPAGTAENKVGEHDANSFAHIDIRLLISDLIQKFNAIPKWSKEEKKPTYTPDEVGAVSYSIQNLTEEQKATARSNIGVEGDGFILTEADKIEVAKKITAHKAVIENGVLRLTTLFVVPPKVSINGKTLFVEESVIKGCAEIENKTLILR